MGCRFDVLKSTTNSVQNNTPAFDHSATKCPRSCIRVSTAQVCPRCNHSIKPALYSFV